MSTIIQQKRGTASQWTATTYVLSAGEFGWETDTNRFKIGDGSTVWGSLPYAAPSLSHTHGNISNSGLLTTSVTATNPVKVLITNSSDAIGLLTTTNASATTFLRGDGTWVTPTDTDTNYYPTAVTMTAGTTAGPLVGLTMNTGTVTSATIPSATTGASGIVTTGAQNFDGIKTFNSFPQVASGLPSNSLDLVNKQYVDNIASGINAHDSVIAATTAALTATYNNNTTGVGATLTNSGTQAALVIDNVSLLSGDRVLVKNQGTTTQNGIYSVTNVGTGSTNWVLTRTSDYDQSIANEVQAGDTTFVVAPTAQYSVAPTNNNTSWTMNSPGTISIGSSSITFVQTNASSGYTAGTGISINSGAIAIDTAVIPRLNAANAFTVGGHTISAESTSVVPLVLNVPTSPLSNIAEFKVNNSNYARISPNGSLATASNLAVGNVAITNSNQLQVSTTSATNIGAVIRGYATGGAYAQTADLMQLQSWDGTTATNQLIINSAGAIAGAQRLTLGSTTVNSAAQLTVALGLDRVAFASISYANSVSDQFQYKNNSNTVIGGRSANAKIYSGSTAPLAVTGASLAMSVVSATYISATTATIVVSNASQPFTASGQTVTLAGISGGTYNGVVTVSSPATVTSGVQYSFTATGTGFTNVAGTGGTAVISPSGNGTTATVVLTNNPAMSVGDLVSINGFTGVTAYNTGVGTFVPVTAVSNVNPFSISYASSASGTAAGSPTITLQSQLSVTATSTLSRGIIVDAPTGMIANMQEWRVNGTSVANVGPAGNMTAPFFISTSGIRAVGNLSTSTIAGTTLVTNATTGHLILQSTATVPNTPTSNAGILYTDTGALKYRGTSGSPVTIANADGTLPSSFTGGTLTGGLTLAAGTSTPLIPLTFTTNASTPTAVSGGMDYDGTVFYQTPSATSGRAIDVDGYYYNNTSAFNLDYSASATAQSIFGGATAGLTVAAGTTYEYELIFRMQGTYGSSGSQTPSFGFTATTLTLSPVLAYNHFIDSGSNTTGYSSATTLTTTGTTTTRALTALTSSFVFYFVRVRGVARITGTGTARIYPSISMNTTNPDNAWSVPAGAVFFKATPIGSGTVSTIGIA